MDTTNSACSEVLSATDAREFFGTNARRARIRFHRLARLVHPDAPGGSDEAMARLNALWNEYNGVGRASVARKSGAKRPKELTRNDTYAIFDDNGSLLVVERAANGHVSDQKTPELLKSVLKGTPTGVFEVINSKVIAQKDGGHAAYVCDSLDEGPILLSALKDRLPKGKLDPADLAWMAKRAIFLGSALAKCGLTPKNEPSECLAVLPDAHMLMLAAPWGLIEAKEGIRGHVIGSFREAVMPMMGSDVKTTRLGSFLRGSMLDNVTPSVDLMREYDELLEELFGGRHFHRMVLF